MFVSTKRWSVPDFIHIQSSFLMHAIQSHIKYHFNLLLISLRMAWGEDAFHSSRHLNHGPKEDNSEAYTAEMV